jgi:hypothetical protein
MAGLSLSDWASWIVIANCALTLILTLLVLYLKGVFVPRDEFGELTKRVQGHAERLTAGDNRFIFLEERIASLPTRESIAALNVSLERLNGDVRVISAQMKGVEELHKTLKHQVELMDQFMRDQR